MHSSTILPAHPGLKTTANITPALVLALAIAGALSPPDDNPFAAAAVDNDDDEEAMDVNWIEGASSSCIRPVPGSNLSRRTLLGALLCCWCADGCAAADDDERSSSNESVGTGFAFTAPFAPGFGLSLSGGTWRPSCTELSALFQHAGEAMLLRRAGHLAKPAASSIEQMQSLAMGSRSPLRVNQ